MAKSKVFIVTIVFAVIFAAICSSPFLGKTQAHSHTWEQTDTVIICDECGEVLDDEAEHFNATGHEVCNGGVVLVCTECGYTQIVDRFSYGVDLDADDEGNLIVSGNVEVYCYTCMDYMSDECSDHELMLVGTDPWVEDALCLLESVTQ